MWTNEVEYIATVNGITIGTFKDMNEALNEATRAAYNGIAGRVGMNDGTPPKVVEVRENRNYTLVTSSKIY